MFSDILFALSIRFFLFDFVLFKTIRERLKEKHYLFKKLLSCPFCQGFWCSLFVYLLSDEVVYLPHLINFAFISAFLSFT